MAKQLTFVFLVTLAMASFLNSDTSPAMKQMDITKYEPTFESIAGLYNRPRTKRSLVNGPLDYKTVEVRPDATIIMKDATFKSNSDRIGLGFFFGKNLNFISPDETKMSLLDNHIPVTQLRFVKDSIEYLETVFTCEAAGRRCIYVRYDLKNTHARSKKDVDIWTTIIQKKHHELYEHNNEDYLPFETVEKPWHEGVESTHSKNCLIKNDKILLSYNIDDGISVEYNSKEHRYPNMLHFASTLSPGECKKIDIIMPYECLDYIEPRPNQEQALAKRTAMSFSSDMTTELWKSGFDEALDRTVKQWKEILNKSTRISVPEEPINRIYNTLTLNCFQLITHSPEKPYYLPGQGGFNNYNTVYGWEAGFMLSALDAKGHHEVVEKVLDYLITTQDNSKGPDGEISSAEGTFRPHIFWMCETGAILKIFAEHCLLSRDEVWFRGVSDSIVKACSWICNERNRTKQFDPNGNKVKHYGLMPKGRVHDWPDRGYFFFTDTNTYLGLKKASEALLNMGHPDGKRFLDEAEDYKKCIEEAIKNATYFDEDGDIYIANEAYGKADGNVMTSYGVDGPLYMIATGLIDAHDDRVVLIEASLRKLGFLNDVFAFRLLKMEDETLENILLKKTGGKYDLFYLTTAENIWHKTWLERGELAKTLKCFYSTLAYATTLDTHIASERFCPQLPFFAPWQPNASANGRIIQMIHRTLFYQDGNELHLLKGMPSPWLKPGKSIFVKDACLEIGKLNLEVNCIPLEEKDILINLKYSLKGTKEIDSLFINLNLPYGYQVDTIKINNNKQKFEYNSEQSTLKIINPADNLRLEVKLANVS